MKTKVVLVDDDVDTLEIFHDYLEMKGVNVIDTGNNGKAAVELFLKHKPDVVLLDVMMPEYDGFFGLTNILKRDSEAKVIMLTADKTPDTKEKLMNLKAAAILYKPYEINTVLKTIEQVKNGEQIIEEIKKEKYTPLC